MALPGLGQFHEVWAADFEFAAPPGDRPIPVCLVAWELKSGRKLRVWKDELEALDRAPYGIGMDVVLVAYYASAELGCHLSLGWPLPVNVLDLYVEFRNQNNGRKVPYGFGLLGAMSWYGLDGIDATEKKHMQELAASGGPWTDAEKLALLDYCETDVVALKKLLPKMLPHLDVPRAVLRGRYMKAVAHMEYNGTPIDLDLFPCFRENWPKIKEHLIAEVDSKYDIFEGHTFKAARFEVWLDKNGIPWPRLVTGALCLDRNTFRDTASIYPEVAPLHEMRTTLSQIRLSDLSVGKDGRNRCLLSPFSSLTGRNQPSPSKFIFGPAKWMRGFIKPAPGHGLAYIDWEQQEFGIAAALSEDPAMMDAYRSGDPYLAFAKQAQAVPPDATKASHSVEREQFKKCALGVNYGMGEKTLARHTKQSAARARELLQLHKQSFPVFWQWSDRVEDHAMLHNVIWTVFGWYAYADTTSKALTFRNFPMQANGAEMLRLACCLATERGVLVCAPVHDALLIEAPLDQLEDAIEQTEKAMVEASGWVLNGFRLRTEVSTVRYPDRYHDERGVEMWNTMQRILAAL